MLLNPMCPYRRMSLDLVSRFRDKTCRVRQVLIDYTCWLAVIVHVSWVQGESTELLLWSFQVCDLLFYSLSDLLQLVAAIIYKLQYIILSLSHFRTKSPLIINLQFPSYYPLILPVNELNIINYSKCFKIGSPKIKLNLGICKNLFTNSFLAFYQCIPSIYLRKFFFLFFPHSFLKLYIFILKSIFFKTRITKKNIFLNKFPYYWWFNFTRQDYTIHNQH